MWVNFQNSYTTEHLWKTAHVFYTGQTRLFNCQVHCQRIVPCTRNATHDSSNQNSNLTKPLTLSWEKVCFEDYMFWLVDSFSPHPAECSDWQIDRQIDEYIRRIVKKFLICKGNHSIILHVQMEHESCLLNSIDILTI